MIAEPKPPNMRVSVRDHENPVSPGQKRPPRGTLATPYHNGGSLEEKRRVILRRAHRAWSMGHRRQSPGDSVPRRYQLMRVKGAERRDSSRTPNRDVNRAPGHLSW